MKVKDRVVKLVRVKAADLRENPFNWRKHPEKQREALQAILEEVGIAGAVLARELDDGTYMLVDGHLRKDTLPDHKIPVLVLDVDEDEANKLLATVDPLGQLAETDEKKLKTLLRGVETESRSLTDLFSGILGKASLASTKDLELDIDGDGEVPAPAEDGILPTSHVRMVQLFLDTNTLPKFEAMVAQLGPRYGTSNMTDTVIKALREMCKIDKAESKEEDRPTKNGKR